MLKNYFKIAIRNLWRNKSISAINIFGLAIGMASAMLILLWIQNEMSMDRFHQNGDRIYMMYNRDKDPEGKIWAWPNTPNILATTLKNDYPEVEDAVRYRNVTFLLTAGEKKLNQRGAFADSGFLNVFSFPLLKGNPSQALNNSYSIVLTEQFAKALFGNEDAMGKIVRVDSVNNCTVTGILKDLPNNTQFNFAYILPWAYMQKLGWDDDLWSNNSVYTYALLKAGTSESLFDRKIKNITIDHTKDAETPSTTEVFTQPLNRVYLYAKSENGKLVAGQIETIRLFSIIAAFILLIACINFMNLSTARSEKRAREVGIRKVVGVQKKSLILQFLGESILISALSFVIALCFVQIALGPFNQLVGKQLFIQYSNPDVWIFSLSFILFAGLLAGSYPAFYLSSFNPISVLKGTIQKTHALVTPRKVLVIIQFTFAIILMIGTVIVLRQIQYGLNRDSGYNRDNLIYIFTQGKVDEHYASIKNELINNGVASSITQSANPITQRWSDSWGFQWAGSTKTDEKIDFVKLQSDADFTKTMGVKIIAGRDLNVYEYPTDSTGIVLNEAAVKAMHVKDPIGMIIRQSGDTTLYHVVGIVKDFIIESPFQSTINPMMIFGPGNMFSQVIHIKLNPSRPTAANISALKEILKKYNPDYPPEIIFADESYARKFSDAQRTGKLAALFAALTIFISCLGLFGLAAYTAESRLKEIGVRKVLGASVSGITTLLSMDFLKLVALSFVIATPIAWWSMSQWLDTYSYRINMEWWVFILAGLLSMIIALLTVCFQAIRAAKANPVKSLRSE
ncbi:MAG: ABC transporter permease [Bacteroidetes bacterium]|nr:ABC transporter permease [Bacteroidota bacterium]